MIHNNTLTRLVKPTPGIDSKLICEDLMEMFEKYSTQSLVVIENNKPIGFLSQKKSADALSSRYGYAIYQKRPVTELMLKDFLMVDAEHSFDDIVQRALVRKSDSVFEDIVVVKDEKYIGMISIDRVLMEQRIRLLQHTDEVEKQSKQLEESNRQLQRALKELQNKEDLLIQSEKMASIGTLASGIAHDFNNMLDAILSSAHLLETKLGADSTMLQYCKIIISAGERSASLTKQLLDFSQKNFINKKIVSLNDIIHETMKIIERSINNGVKIELSLDSNINKIEADDNQIQQVLMNLIINARDSMPNGGTIKISTSIINFSSLNINNSINTSLKLKDGNYIQLSIEDTGHGISPEHLPKIFEPFFTTKPIGKGTGLGLAVVYGIIQRHDAYIEVDSNIGKGTIFKIYFKPYISKELKDEISTQKIEQEKGAGKILLVDDEELVLLINGEFLESLGYDVIKANSGEDAITIYKEQWKSIDLVVLDMLMPGKNGRETFCEMHKINSDVKAVVVSGYTDDEGAKQIIDDGVLVYIRKPFNHNEFSQIIKSILSNSQQIQIPKFITS